MAREKNIEVFVDGAHAFAQFPFQRDELECDYYGTSLHKWLLAPIGAGFLYVRKEKQKRIWPLMAAPAAMDENVRKYEEIGTHPAANHNAIAGALAFHRGIGVERKAARLRFLRDRWAKRLLAADPRVRVLTPLNDTEACGIGLIHLEGVDTPKLQARPLGEAPHHDDARSCTRSSTACASRPTSTRLPPRSISSPRRSKGLENRVGLGADHASRAPGSSGVSGSGGTGERQRASSFNGSANVGRMR